jgi:hypothetical protein
MPCSFGGGRLMCYLVEDRERCMERCRVDRRVESSLTNTYVMYRQSNAAIIFILPRPGRARTPDPQA